MKLDQVRDFEKIEGQLQSMFEELSNLAKKKPDDAINKFKLKIINELLIKSSEILGESYTPVQGFTKFDEDDLPTNSDALVVCSQYISCMEMLRANSIRQDQEMRWVWMISDSDTVIRTAPPKKLNLRE